MIRLPLPSNYLNRKQQIKMNFKWTYLLILVGLIAVILPYVAADQTAAEKTMQQKIQEKVAEKVKEQVVEEVQEQVRQEMLQTMAKANVAGNTGMLTSDMERAFQWRITVFGFIWFTFVFVVGYFI
eukprot:TRINITY_DN4469_c0_g1_i2.p1 TRINITY_DN4469_c0_g1~~TRINITY_DN4469_c0_g1_i2.p1  ORF type:complete len:126 (-),score=28.55 TRINITY_DN4469_c0_g1_i2:44-421(-)